MNYSNFSPDKTATVIKRMDANFSNTLTSERENTRYAQDESAKNLFHAK